MSAGSERQDHRAVAFGSQPLPAVNRDYSEYQHGPLVALANYGLFAEQIHGNRERKWRNVVAAHETSLRAAFELGSAMVGKPSWRQLHDVLNVNVQTAESFCKCFVVERAISVIA